MTDAEWVRHATDPEGHHFALFVGAPASALDAGDVGVTLIGVISNAVATLFRSFSRKWRVAVNEASSDGRLGPIVLRESFATKTECIDRLGEIADEIESGQHSFPASWWR